MQTSSSLLPPPMLSPAGLASASPATPLGPTATRPANGAMATPAFGAALDQDRRFADVLRAYKDVGGLGRGDEVAERFRACGGELSQLARWIVERHVLSFEWRSELWLPWFQFHPVHMTVDATTRQIAGELTGTFDGMQLARWFVEPNCWLGNRKPAALLADAPDDVRHAARTDRFVAQG